MRSSARQGWSQVGRTPRENSGRKAGRLRASRGGDYAADVATTAVYVRIALGSIMKPVASFRHSKPPLIDTVGPIKRRIRECRVAMSRWGGRVAGGVGVGYWQRQGERSAGTWTSAARPESLPPPLSLTLSLSLCAALLSSLSGHGRAFCHSLPQLIRSQLGAASLWEAVFASSAQVIAEVLLGDRCHLSSLEVIEAASPPDPSAREKRINCPG